MHGARKLRFWDSNRRILFWHHRGACHPLSECQAWLKKWVLFVFALKVKHWHWLYSLLHVAEWWVTPLCLSRLLPLLPLLQGRRPEESKGEGDVQRAAAEEVQQHGGGRRQQQQQRLRPPPVGGMDKRASVLQQGLMSWTRHAMDLMNTVKATG